MVAGAPALAPRAAERSWVERHLYRAFLLLLFQKLTDGNYNNVKAASGDFTLEGLKNGIFHSTMAARSEDFNIIPDWDGQPDTFDTFETSCQWYVMGLKPTERGQAAARVWRRLKGAPKQALQHLNPKDFQGEDSIDKLLVILKQSPLQTMALPDAFQKLESYHHLRRQPKEMVANLRRGQQGLETSA